jgi:hypothetical protein
MGSGFLFAGLMTQHVALIQRQMRFRALARVEVGSQVVAAAAGVAAALAGWGYWALVVRGVTGSFVQMVAVWVAVPWRPDRPRRAAGSGSLVRFGGYITAFQAVNYVGRNLDNVLIGRVLGGATLGIYSKAYQLLMLPLSMVNGPISGVAVPALARLQSNPERLPTIAYCYHGTPFTLAGLFAVLWRPATAAVLAGVVTFYVHAAFPPSTWPLFALAASFPFFAAVYLGALLMLPGGRERVGELIGHAKLLRGRPAEALG